MDRAREVERVPGATEVDVSGLWVLLDVVLVVGLEDEAVLDDRVDERVDLVRFSVTPPFRIARPLPSDWK